MKEPIGMTINSRLRVHSCCHSSEDELCKTHAYPWIVTCGYSMDHARVAPSLNNDAKTINNTSPTPLEAKFGDKIINNLVVAT